MPQDASNRPFIVHGLDEAASHGRRVAAPTFEAAALGFLEAHHPRAQDDEVALMVEDCATGERQCFRVDLARGAAAPCD